MKIRTSLLVACIVVVPLVAMFSHRVPAGTRAAVTAWLRDRVGPRSEQPVAASAPVPPAAPAAVAVAAVAQDSAEAPDAAAAAARHVAAPGPVPPAGAPTDAVRQAVAEDGAPRVVPVTALAADTDAFGSLRALGAIAIDCRPLPGNAGHVASCRLPIDAAGELERVFQAVGTDAPAAAGNLLRDVTSWQRRAPRERARTMRF